MKGCPDHGPWPPPCFRSLPGCPLWPILGSNPGFAPRGGRMHRSSALTNCQCSNPGCTAHHLRELGCTSWPLGTSVSSSVKWVAVRPGCRVHSPETVAKRSQEGLLHPSHHLPQGVSFHWPGSEAPNGAGPREKTKPQGETRPDKDIQGPVHSRGLRNEQVRCP